MKKKWFTDSNMFIQNVGSQGTQTGHCFTTLFKESRTRTQFKVSKLQVHEPINSMPKLLSLSACTDR